MSGFQDIHRAETIAYVLGKVRDLHADETARVTIYSRQPHAIALEHIARDRAGRLEQLVRAIEAGLFDQLDADSATTAIVTAAIDATTTPAQVLDLREPEYYDAEEAAAVREIEREMAIEAGDDSELDRQITEDDARAERRSHEHCPGCPQCTGYADPNEPDDEDDDEPYPLTNADVLSAEELYEYDRDDEFRLDADDEARNIAEAEANDHHDAYDDEPYEADEDGDED